MPPTTELQASSPAIPVVGSLLRRFTTSVELPFGPLTGSSISCPAMKITALRFTETAGSRIAKTGGECLTFDQLALRAPLGQYTVFGASKLNSVDLSHSANMFRASKLKSVDFYRKTPKDLTEGSVLGAILSLMVLFAIVVLFGKELNAYLLVNKSTQVTVDKSIDGELLHINFDISFPSLSCEFASVDVSDVLGTKSFNVTKSVHKYSIDANLNSTGSKFYSGQLPRIQNHKDEEEFDGYHSLSLTAENFDKYSRLRDILVVNFYAPWCQRSNKLKPSWEKAAKILRERYDPKWSGVLMARVDCTQEAELCRRHHITGYPTIRVFRRGSNATENNGHFEHDTYYGSHDTESLVNTMETLVESVPREAQIITDIMTMNRLNRHPAPLADGC